MKRININEAYGCITSVMAEAIKQYGPITNTDNYHWVIGVNIITVLDDFFIPTDAPIELARTLYGIDVELNMSDPDIIQLHRIISACHANDINA